MKPDTIIEGIENFPDVLPILPLRNTVGYPFSMMPLMIGVPRSIKLMEDAMEGDRLVGLVTMKDPSIEEPSPGQVYEMGTIAKINRIFKAPNNTMQAVVQGLERFRIDFWKEDRPLSDGEDHPGSGYHHRGRGDGGPDHEPQGPGKGSRQPLSEHSRRGE